MELGLNDLFNAKLIRMSQGLPPDSKLSFIPAFIPLQTLDQRRARAILPKN